VANDRQVITIIEIDVPAAEFRSASASLTRPDSLARLAGIVETTQLEGVYEDISTRSRCCADNSSRPRPTGPSPPF
jgi:hypothetical protein